MAACCGSWPPAATPGSLHDDADEREERLLALAAERLGINPAAVRDGKWEELGIDSIEWLELVMDFEEEE